MKGKARKEDSIDTVVIFTDGACQGNPGPGGWAALLKFRDVEKEISGSERWTTNNRMELMAAIAALETLKRPCSVTVTTDSQYVKNGITKWIHAWKKKGWRTSKNGNVKNVDLWKRLDAAVSKHSVQWEWVYGHSGHRENEIVDRLAREAIGGRKA